MTLANTIVSPALYDTEPSSFRVALKEMSEEKISQSHIGIRMFLCADKMTFSDLTT